MSSARETDACAWKGFQANGYATDKVSYSYILLTGRDAQRVVLEKDQKLKARLRFGSNGDSVEQVQEAVKELHLYAGQIDRDFGIWILRALLRYKTQEFTSMMELK